ncbi:GTPase IMAP family member 7-like [Seriola lalandi dorsalis]|uniref:GTPase IMAP family member 7-like n=1 Tax=Seriola lalandi dorsalis TaxID=1841481 RepID=UPI000C6FB8E3|nr:GTPase IMAP family member 7-like [Seriola lalandi dorsalis]
MVGWVFSGKSAAGNRILRSKEFQSGERTMKALKQIGEVAGREVVIVDTPGWWKFFPASLIPEDVKSEILEGVSMCSPSPNVVLLVVPLDTSFTDEQKRVTEDNMRLLGQRVWRHVILLFTSGDTLGNKTIEQHIESEGKPLRGLIEKCGKRYHVLDNMNEAGDQVTELLEKMEEMVAGNCSLYLSETDDPQQEEKSDEPTKNKDESTAKEITEQLNNEWDRKNWEKHCTLKGDDSMSFLMTFSEDKQRLKDFEGEEKDKLQSEDDAGSVSLNTKELFEREWIRQEASVEHFHRFFAGERAISEPDADKLRESREKVRSWWETIKTSGYGSNSTTSSEAEEETEQEVLPC